MAEEEKNVRLVRVGDVVRVMTPLGEVTEPVRRVQVTLHLGGGQLATLNISDNVVVVTDEDEDAEITAAEAVVAAEQSEG